MPKNLIALNFFVCNTHIFTLLRAYKGAYKGGCITTELRNSYGEPLNVERRLN